MTHSELAAELQQLLQDNADGFAELLDTYAGKPPEESIKEALDSFTEAAKKAAIIVQGLSDRDAVFIHLRNVADSAFTAAQMALAEGADTEQTIEKARTAILRAFPIKPKAA